MIDAQFHARLGCESGRNRLSAALLVSDSYFGEKPEETAEVRQFGWQSLPAMSDDLIEDGFLVYSFRSQEGHSVCREGSNVFTHRKLKPDHRVAAGFAKLCRVRNPHEKWSFNRSMQRRSN